MTERQRRLSAFFLGVGAYCGSEVVSGHHTTMVSGALAAGLVVLCVAVWVRGAGHRRVVRVLRASSVPAELAGTAIRTGELGEGAFVAGLARPTIYCDRHLPARLTDRQLRAVLLHERAHQRAFDPVRLLLLDLAAPVLRCLPNGRASSTWRLAQREIAADRYALAHGATRADLAGALIQVPRLATTDVTGFGSAIDLRLQALFGEEVGPPGPIIIRRITVLLSGAVAGVSVCAWFLHGLLAWLAAL